MLVDGDARDPDFPALRFVPNFFLMEAYTVIVGVLVGGLACAVWAGLTRYEPPHAQ